jgi:hypothetical protein
MLKFHEILSGPKIETFAFEISCKLAAAEYDGVEDESNLLPEGGHRTEKVPVDFEGKSIKEL